MSLALDETISEEELSLNRRHFFNVKEPNLNDKFRYGFCLIKCTDKPRIQRALNMFTSILDQVGDDNVGLKRDVLYYMAIGEAKLYNYEQSLNYLKQIYVLKQNNSQVDELYAEINRRLKRDGLIGLGATVGAGGAVLLGMGLYGAVKVVGTIIKTIKS